LQYVADKQLLAEIDTYTDKLKMFCAIMADLGIFIIAQKAQEIAQLDPEGDNDPMAVAAAIPSLLLIPDAPAAKSAAPSPIVKPTKEPAKHPQASEKAKASSVPTEVAQESAPAPVVSQQSAPLEAPRPRTNKPVAPAPRKTTPSVAPTPVPKAKPAFPSKEQVAEEKAAAKEAKKEQERQQQKLLQTITITATHSAPETEEEEEEEEEPSKKKKIRKKKSAAKSKKGGGTNDDPPRTAKPKAPARLPGNGGGGPRGRGRGVGRNLSKEEAREVRIPVRSNSNSATPLASKTSSNTAAKASPAQNNTPASKDKKQKDKEEKPKQEEDDNEDNNEDEENDEAPKKQPPPKKAKDAQKHKRAAAQKPPGTQATGAAGAAKGTAASKTNPAGKAAGPATTKGATRTTPATTTTASPSPKKPTHSNNTVPIIIHTPNQTKLTMLVNPSKDKIGTIKKALVPKIGLSVEQQRMFMKYNSEQELDFDDTTLAFVGIKENSELQVDPKWIQIYVKLVPEDGTNHVLSKISPTQYTINNLKGKIERGMGIAVERQLLHYQDQVLADGRKLIKDVGIRDGSTIVVELLNKVPIMLVNTMEDNDTKKHIQLMVDVSNDTLDDIKRQLEPKTRIQANNQRLFRKHTGTELIVDDEDECCCLQEYGIQEGSELCVEPKVIHVLVEMPSGKIHQLTVTLDSNMSDLIRAMVEKETAAASGSNNGTKAAAITEQVFKFHGKELQSAQTVKEMGLKEGSKIKLESTIDR
jgi:hypothetical protein